MCKVSVILPSYNVAQYIRECLESVINQTLPDIELLCVDAESSDGTLEILREYAQNDTRIRVILSDRKSYGYQMNLGLKAARGEYIGIVETDDYIPPTMYDDLYALAMRERAEIVKADFYRFTEEGTTITRTYNRLDPTDSFYGRILDPSHTPQVFRFIMNTWSGIYLRSFLLKNEIWHHETDGASYQDNGFWFKTFCCAKRIYFVGKPYYMNRRDNASSSVLNPGKVYCMSAEWAYIYDWLRQNLQRFKAFQGSYALRKYHSLLFTYQRIAPRFRESFIRHFSEEMRLMIESNEYDRSAFTSYEWRRLHMIAYTPELYHAICSTGCYHRYPYQWITGGLHGHEALCLLIRKADRWVNRLELFFSFIRYEGLLQTLHHIRWKNKRDYIDKGNAHG